MDFKAFLNLNYLFDPLPYRETRIYLPFILFFSAGILLAIALKLLENKQIHHFKNYFFIYLTCSLIGLINLFARYEGLAWLGLRAVLILDILIIFITGLINIVILIGKIPEAKKVRNNEDRYNKYLPRPKKSERRN
jgi:hypothetical protein